jgi:hypothetical protein
MSEEIDNVALKLPEVWTEDIETWFVQAEAQFAIRKIKTEETKFYHVVGVLNHSTASRVKAVLRDPGATPYTTLKQALLSKFEKTDCERARLLCALRH